MIIIIRRPKPSEAGTYYTKSESNHHIVVIKHPSAHNNLLLFVPHIFLLDIVFRLHGGTFITISIVLRCYQDKDTDKQLNQQTTIYCIPCLHMHTAA